MKQNEIQWIKEQFDKVIRYSQNIKEPKTEKLFEIWAKQKNRFIELFGNKCIYEFPEPVSFELSQTEKEKRIDNFITSIETYWNQPQLAAFIQEQAKSFFENLTSVDYIAPDNKLIKSGTKLIKSFSHFITDDKRLLTDIQNYASRIIQENKVEGTLCLSVHPLDFLSLSENNYNWRSCHSLDGEYRAGNLSYMMDNNTVICYLKGADDVPLQAFGPVTWNSKKWRVLLFVSNDCNMVIAGRQYPFESKSGMDIVLRQLLFQSGICKIYGTWDRWSDWNAALNCISFKGQDKYITLEDFYIPTSIGLVDLQQLYQVHPQAKNFDDVLHSSCYKPFYTIKYSGLSDNPYVSLDKTLFEIGNMTYCLECGEAECLKAEDTMRCGDCEFEYGTTENDIFGYCECCGRRMYIESSYTVNDEMWCETCFDQYAKQCERCGSYHYQDYVKYDNETQQYLCSACLEELYGY